MRQILFLLLLVTWPLRLLAVLPPASQPLPNYDRRTTLPPPPSLQQSGLQSLRASTPDAKVSFDPITVSPRWVRSESGFLSRPQALSALLPGVANQTNDPNRSVKAFLDSQTNLFGHGAAALATARITREFVGSHNGLRTVVWQQELEGIPVFEGVLIAHTTKNEELVSVCSGFVPDVTQAATTGTPNRASLQVGPTITAQAAVVLAGKDLGELISPAEVKLVEAATFGPTRRQHLNAPQLKAAATVELVWLPVSRDQLRLCWQVTLASRARRETFRIILDAETGELFIRHGLTSYISNATYRVFTSDSPSPFSPSYSTPTNSEPPLVSRSLVTLPALDTNTSPSGWIADGDNETRGNNVDAHTDRTDDDLPDLPRPQGSPFRVFDFPMDLNSQDPTAYSNAAVVQLFYWCNWMHDRLYELGFNEAAGNFQNDNFGRGGAGNDAVQADAQDGGAFNNANFTVDFDGNPGRMQMYIFNGPTPDRDGDLDGEVILHEYTHGLSNRRVGGGVLISALQTAGMGEGWSDFYAMSLLSEAADDVNGVYPFGAYVSRLLIGLTQNYYFGIRRYPYCTDLTKNPLTFKDIDPTQASSHAGIPRSILGGPADEVHSQGEVWCAVLWEARAKLIQKLGWVAGNQLALQLVTDGMNLSPVNPNFLEARDALLQADLVDRGGTDLPELWAAFAKRGMGYTATSPSSATTSGVHEAFDLPFDSLMLLPASGLDSSGPQGGPYIPPAQTYTLANSGTNALSWSGSVTASWLTLSATSGNLPTNGSPATVTVSINSAANLLSKGVYTAAVWFTNLSSGAAFSRPARLVLGKSVLGWGDTSRGARVPDNLIDVVAISSGNYDNLALKRDGTVVGWGPNYTGQTNIPAGLSNVTAIALGGLHALAMDTNGHVTAWGSDQYTESEVPPDLNNALAIAAGFAHSLALNRNGTVVAWGAGKSVLNDGINYGQSIVPAGLSNVVAIAAGFHNSMALKSDGTVVCWGDNSWGRATPPAGLSNVTAIAVNQFQSMALKRDGTVVVWGNQTPPPADLTNVAAICVSEHHALVLKANGTVESWGTGFYGETTVPAGLTNVVAISAGWYHSLALVNDGSLSAPLIYKPPLDCVAARGTSAVFNSAAVGTPLLGFRWQKNGVPLSNGSNVAGADLPALLLSNVALSDSGAYSVVVTNFVGSVTSSVGTLTVQDPGIISQPSSRSNVFGTPATFTVVAAGSPPLGYRWYKNLNPVFDNADVSGAATPTLTIFSVKDSDADVYRVRITNSLGSVDSLGATLTVISVPQITNQPMSRTKILGRTAHFTVGALGSLPLSYRWTKDNVSLGDGGNIQGSGNATLTVSNVTYADIADYRVIVTNIWGSITSAPARLTVNSSRGHLVAWGISQHGETNLPPGLTNVVSIASGGYHHLAIRDNGTVIGWGDTNYIPSGISNIAAVSTTHFGALALKEDDTVLAYGYNYYGEAYVPAGLSNVVAVSAGYGFSSALTENGKVVVWGDNPYGLTNHLDALSDTVAISAGDSHLLALNRNGTVTAIGGNYSGQTNVPVDLSNAVAVAAGGQHSLALKADGTVVAWGASVSGQTSVPAGLTNVVAIAAGLNSSMALKNDGTVSVWGSYDNLGSAYVPPGLNGVTAVAGGYNSMLALVNDLLPPAITSGPFSRTNNAGTAATFAVQTTGAQPLTFQWRRNGVNLNPSGNNSGVNSPTFTVSNVVRTTSGLYSVAVSNAAGFVISADAMLTVIDPAINTPPASRTNISGTTAAFTVTAFGSFTLNYQWFKNGIALTNGGKIAGATSANLAVSAVSQADAGGYSVSVRNIFGTVTSAPPALLTVLDPPTLSSQPANRTNYVGETASFSVNALGTAPLAYQWQKDGIVLANSTRISGGDSNTLSISNIDVGDTGLYRVLITNVAGSITSSVARLAVLQPLLVFTQPVFTLATGSAQLNGMVSPLGVAASAWFEWGTNAGYGQITPAQSTGSGQGVVFVSTPISNLAHGAVVHFRAAASNATQIVYGLDQQFVTTGRSQAWGDNSSGQIALPANLHEVSVLGGGLSHTLALQSDGTLRAWGNNSFGQTNPPASLTNIGLIAAGGFHNLALRIDGTVAAWGRNDSGQTNVPSGLSNVVSLAAGGSHSLALKHDGTVVAWGNNALGQTTVPATASNTVAIAAGWYHSLALRNDGTVRAWGANTYGQISAPPGLTNVVWIGAGLYHSLALLRDGTLVAWGNNALGQTNIPANLTNIIAAACGGSHNLALSANDTLSAWGYSLYGQTNTPSALTNAVILAAGGTHSLAITPNRLPLALFQITNGYINHDLVISLSGTDPDGDLITHRLVAPPSLGKLYQFTNGTRGPALLAADTPITDPSGRLIFAPGTNQLGAPYSSFNFLATDGVADSSPSSVLINILLPPAPSVLPAASGLLTNGFALVFSGAPNASYSVYASTNLSTWTRLGPAQPIGPGLFQFIEPASSNWPRRFYRAGAP